MVKPAGLTIEPRTIEYFISLHFLWLLELDLQVFPLTLKNHDGTTHKILHIPFSPDPLNPIPFPPDDIIPPALVHRSIPACEWGTCRSHRK